MRFRAGIAALVVCVVVAAGTGGAAATTAGATRTPPPDAKVKVLTPSAYRGRPPAIDAIPPASGRVEVVPVATARPRHRGVCPLRAFRVRFRPRATVGHPRPHVAVFKGSRGGAKAERLVYVDATHVFAGVVCGRPDQYALRLGQMKRKVRTTSAVDLVCRPGDLVLLSSVGSARAAASGETWNGGELNGIGPHRRILWASFRESAVSPNGDPVLQYDATVCSKV